MIATAVTQIQHTFVSAKTYPVTLRVYDCRDVPGSVTAPIKVGTTASAGSGATRGICRSRRRQRITLPHAHGSQPLSLLVTSQGRTLRSLKSGALRGPSLTISFFGLAKVPVTVSLRSRRGGHVVTRRIVFHPCTKGPSPH